MWARAAGGAVRVRARVSLNTPTWPGQAPFMKGAQEEAGKAWSVEEWRGFVERDIGNGSTVLADCQLVYEITASPFERRARIRMR
jgi:hypothetical protein